MVVRQYQEEIKYLEKITETCWRIKKGFQPNMKVIIYDIILMIYNNDVYNDIYFRV